MSPNHIRTGLISVTALIASTCGTAAFAAGDSDGDWHAGDGGIAGDPITHTSTPQTYVEQVRPETSKNAAILGRQVSALEAMQAAQNISGQRNRSKAASLSRTPARIVEKRASRASYAGNARTVASGVATSIAGDRLASNHSNATIIVVPQTQKTTLTAISLDRESPLHPNSFAAPEFQIVSKQSILWRYQSNPFGLATKIRSNRLMDFGIFDDQSPQTRLFDAHLAVLKPIAVTPAAHYKSVKAAPVKAVIARKRAGGPEYRRTIFNGRPDVFGSTALSVRTTPLDRKWNRVRRFNNASRTFLRAINAGRQNRMAGMQSINKWVNDRVQYADDRQFRGTGDHWAKAEETLRSRKGDCEDYAIAKMQLLKAYGVPSRDMFLVIAKDLVRRADHALLVVQHEGRLLVLDSETDLILDADKVKDYRPIMSYSSAGKWLHGYKAKPRVRPIQTAALAVGR